MSTEEAKYLTGLRRVVADSAVSLDQLWPTVQCHWTSVDEY